MKEEKSIGSFVSYQGDSFGPERLLFYTIDLLIQQSMFISFSKTSFTAIA